MSSAYFIVAERALSDVDVFVNGKAVASASEELDKLADQLGVRPLSSFISISPEAAASFLENEGIDAADADLPPTTWFDVGDGLASVQRLREHIETYPESVASSAAVTTDLREYEQVLSRLADCNVRWHFEVDF